MSEPILIEAIFNITAEKAWNAITSSDEMSNHEELPLDERTMMWTGCYKVYKL
jgi:uncharacterized protein (UPF0147 family)